ncbi:DNA-3-methyladenine glycosylase I [Bifidobacterium sp.]|jgi:DNA-3-methyladenine glycosylase I|uniref:DNA-3-methyladenine glycosylase I n=1 Tax=Bifidobacterium sp. TaxID=41200 RepID=UPI0025BDA0B3|nr:DNA-3-methyladenine glycosylase I [Bifidobacterium sp.]MCI1634712.1 DNA-3-methyladenine glycosylase I [Bifidobacterium sp.]
MHTDSDKNAASSDELPRCSWANTDDDAMRRYHDSEWGQALHNSRALFELLSLELMQSGLSWKTILHKRQGFIEAFDNFDAHSVMNMASNIDSLLTNPSIIRNRKKIQAIITNAQAIVRLEDNNISFTDYIWNFVDGVAITNAFVDHAQAPCETPRSTAMSKQMKHDGFRFVGPIVAYSFMEAAGLVNDHEIHCFRWKQIAQ